MFTKLWLNLKKILLVSKSLTKDRAKVKEFIQFLSKYYSVSKIEIICYTYYM